jgi:hypothetical protein
LDINSPTPVEASRFQEDLALMLLESSYSRDPWDLELYSTEETTSTQGAFKRISNSTREPSQNSAKYKIGEDDVQAITITHQRLFRDLSTIKTKRVGEKFKKVPISPPIICTIDPGQSLSCGLGIPFCSWSRVELSVKDVSRWTMAAQAMKKETKTYRLGPQRFGSLTMVSKHCGNFQNYSFHAKITERFDQEFSASFRGGWLPCLLLPIFYGGIHLCAWNFEFPSLVEHTMWKAACLATMCSVFAALVTLIVVSYIHHVLSARFVTFEKLEKLFLALARILVGLVLILTCCARIFLFVESFISIRRLPIGVYTTVDWSNYIPHL